MKLGLPRIRPRFDDVEESEATLHGYRLERVIGREASGLTTYEACRSATGERVRISASPAPEEARLRRQVRRRDKRRAAIRHPNVMPARDTFEEAGQHYLVTELNDAPTLATRLESGALEPRLAVGILSQVSEGIEAAQAAGIADSLLSPANILLDPSGRAILTDLGSATTLSDLIQPWAHPDAAYFSPELGDGQHLGARTSVYSLGCILFEALVGSPPYQGNWLALSDLHLRDRVPAVSERRPELGTSFDPVIARALAQDPSARFASPGELTRAAAAALAEAGENPAAAATMPIAAEGEALEADAAEGAAEVEELARREAEELARRDAEEAARRDAEEAARRDAEELARRDAEELARRDAEELARRDAEELARRDAEEKARLEADETARREAEAQARREAEEAALREAEAQTRREVEAEARREAEAAAAREVEERALREAEATALREAEATALREAEVQAQREAEAEVHAATPAAPARTQQRARSRGGSSRVVLLACAVAATVALGGYLVGSAGDPATAPVRSVANGPLSLELPSGWERRPTAGGVPGLPLKVAVAAGPQESLEAGLVAARTSGSDLLPPGVRRVSGGRAVPVHLGRFDAYRRTGRTLARPARQLRVYAVPTTEGAVVVACHATASGPRG